MTQMKKIGFLFCLLLVTVVASAQSTLYFNGKIFTNDSSSPEATYFVVENGIITQTGNDLTHLDLKNFANQVDLQSKTVIPGIIDSHIHFIDAGLGLLQTSFFNVSSKEQFLKKLELTKTDLLDGMYIGRELGYETLKDVENPIQVLDKLMPDTPAIIFLKSGHAAIANSKAMKKLGFNKSTIIKDGTIQLDAAGNLNGYLLEGAAMEASRIISSRYSEETIQKAILKAQALALSYGITTIGDNTFNPYFFKIYQELQKNDLLKIRVRARSYGRMPQTEGLMQSVGKKHLGLIGGGVDEARVKYHAMKFFEDQSLSINPHHDGPVAPGGKIFLDEKQLKGIFQLHPKSTFAFHVQGKEGVQNILNVVKANQTNSSHQRHIIDHAGYTSLQQMEQASNLGLGVTIIAGQLFDYKNLSSFYKTHSSSEFHFDESDLLNTRVKFQSARGALTSDYPYGMDTLFAEYPQIDGLNPFPMIAVNVTGRYPDGSPIEGVETKTLSVEEAIEAFTANGAYVLNEDKTLGKIAPGYYADFIVLQEDIFSASAFELYSAMVLETYINGELVYESSKSGDIKVISEKIKVSPSDYAISPVIGYDPTLGLILGGAYFKFPLKTPGRYFDVQLQTISHGKFNLQSTYTHFDLIKNVNFTFAGSYSNFFQYYFGEGNETEANIYTKLFSNNYRLRPDLTFKLRSNFQISAFMDVRGREETKATDINDVDLNKTFFPDEHTVALGLTLQQDSRDNTFSTKKGTLKLIRAHYIPSAWNVEGLGDVAQVTAEIRHIRYIGNSNFVIASRLAAGFSKGTPSYLFRYALGGSYSLRGYYANRFRGEKYYVGQLEVRFPIYKRFSGATFFDAGDVTDQDFIKPKYTYGAGLRFALSQNIKLRLDYGIAKDQTGVFFTFSEAF